MKYCKQIFALSVVAILALVSFFPVGSAWGQPSPLFPGDQIPPTFAVSPFFIDATNDGSVIVANTGESGDLCANIYLFTPAGQMTACVETEASSNQRGHLFFPAFPPSLKDFVVDFGYVKPAFPSK